MALDEDRDDGMRRDEDPDLEDLADDSDLDDLPDPTRRGFDIWLLTDERMLRVVSGLGVAIAVMVWPDRTDRVLLALLGGFIAASSFSMGRAALADRPRRLPDVALALVGLIGGGLLLVFPGRSLVLIARLAAAALAVVTVKRLGEDLRRTDGDGPAWPIARTIALLCVAAALAIFPSELLATATALIALAWAAVGLLSLRDIMVEHEPGTERRADALVTAWLDEQAQTPADRQVLYAKILYEGPTLSLRLARFITLMALASAIASMGVITDSTAVVIGAMLIAPLMTPLMAVAVSVVMGWPRRLARSAAVAGGGIVLSIAIGIVLGAVVPAVIDVSTNSQIIARSSPTTLDLIIAVAAGAAGAYGLSRSDVSDALPGVAIAISLVPPLSVVGIAWSQGAWQEGNGALLLFVTNALAIIVVGGITFILTGVTPVRRVTDHQFRVRTASAAIAALAVIVVGALALNGAQVTANALAFGRAQDAAVAWIDEAPRHDLVEVRIDGSEITAVIVGPPADSPTAEALRERLVDRFGEDVVVVVRLLVEQRDVAG
ncbi:MAG: DUF389 domain-containing protein [Actinomycetota bacterium]